MKPHELRMRELILYRERNIAAQSGLFVYLTSQSAQSSNTNGLRASDERVDFLV